MNEWVNLCNSLKILSPITKVKQEGLVHPHPTRPRVSVSGLPSLFRASCTFPFTRFLCDLTDEWRAKILWLIEQQHKIHTGSAARWLSLNPHSAIYCVTLDKETSLCLTFFGCRESHLPRRATGRRHGLIHGQHFRTVAGTALPFPGLLNCISALTSLLGWVQVSHIVWVILIPGNSFLVVSSLGKFFNPHFPWFPHVWNGNKNNTHSIGLVWGLKRVNIGGGPVAQVVGASCS